MTEFEYPKYEEARIQYLRKHAAREPYGSIMTHLGKHVFADRSSATTDCYDMVTADCWCVYVEQAGAERKVIFDTIATEYKFNDEHNRRSHGDERENTPDEVARTKIQDTIVDFVMTNLTDDWDGTSGTSNGNEIHVVMGGDPFIRFVYSMREKTIDVNVYSAIPGDTLALYY